jgi:hypothetical protein
LIASSTRKSLNFEIICSTSETAALLQNKPIVYPDTIFKLTPRYYENKRQGNFLKAFHQRIIDERREILKNNNNKPDKEDPGYNIFIDHILNNEGMFSDEDTQHHVITVLSAGDYRNLFHGQSRSERLHFIIICSASRLIAI